MKSLLKFFTFKKEQTDQPRSLADIISHLDQDIAELQQRAEFDKQEANKVAQEIEALKLKEAEMLKDSERGLRIAGNFKELLK